MKFFSKKDLAMIVFNKLGSKDLNVLLCNWCKVQYPSAKQNKIVSWYVRRLLRTRLIITSWLFSQWQFVAKAKLEKKCVTIILTWQQISWSEYRLIQMVFFYKSIILILKQDTKKLHHKFNSMIGLKLALEKYLVFNNIFRLTCTSLSSFFVFTCKCCYAKKHIKCWKPLSLSYLQYKPSGIQLRTYCFSV